MAEVILEIGGFRYPLACRDGEQEHFQALAKRIDDRVTEAKQAVGSVSEARQLLFAALLLADALKESEAKLDEAEALIPAQDTPQLDPVALESLADRLELVAAQLENRAGSA